MAETTTSDSVRSRLEAVRYYNLLAHGADIQFIKVGDLYIHIRSTTSFDPVHMSERSFLEKAEDLLSTKEAQAKILRRHLDAIITENAEES